MNIAVDEALLILKVALHRPALPLHLADRPQREPRLPHRPLPQRERDHARRPTAAAARASRRCSARSWSCSRARRSTPGEEVPVDSLPVAIGRGGQNEVAARRRRVRLGPARPLRVEARRPLGRGRRLDERHVRQRRARDDAAAALEGRRRPRRPDRLQGRALMLGRSAVVYRHRPPAAAERGRLRLRAAALRRRRRDGRRAGGRGRVRPRGGRARGGAGDERGEERVASLIQEANRRVFQRSSEDESASGMGTTMTVALVDGEARSRSATSATRARTASAAACSSS